MTRVAAQTAAMRRSADALSRRARAPRRRRAARARRAVSRAHAHPAQDRRAVLHRQDAEQLRAHRPDPADAAEREDHRRAPASAGLLLLRLQAALRARAELQLRPRRHRPLLPRLRRADGALRRRAAGPRPSRDLRSAWSTTPKPRCGACSTTAACRSRTRACASSRTSGRCAPPAPNRCASRSTAKASTSGGITSRGSGR